jgi:alkanesulfonate monooxygenase SsuD/methylene tetrahydromethanopterin reductase-like flavin-dependent oxidoreductase (luciferase family)
MKVGVLLPSRFEDPGEFLADARAMEAARVDSIWLEEGDGYDPMLALAAIAAVTSQLRLGLITLNTPSPFGKGSGRGFETLQHLSRHRVITGTISLPLEGRVGEGVIGTERWRRVEMPADREAWAQTLEQARPDFDGVLVAMDPRLLDILRHPEDAIDRSDLLLAQG